MSTETSQIQLTYDYKRRLLEYLQGWIVVPDTPCERIEYAKSFIDHEEIEDSLNVVNKITESELEIYFQKGQMEVQSYLWRNDIPPVPPVHEALLQWTAGLIWKKYNIKPVELRDGTTSLGYGDRLIAIAKRTLKNYIRTRLRSLT